MLCPPESDEDKCGDVLYFSYCKQIKDQNKQVFIILASFVCVAKAWYILFLCAIDMHRPGLINPHVTLVLSEVLHIIVIVFFFMQHTVILVLCLYGCLFQGWFL